MINEYREKGNLAIVVVIGAMICMIGASIINSEINNNVSINHWINRNQKRINAESCTDVAKKSIINLFNTKVYIADYNYDETGEKYRYTIGDNVYILNEIGDMVKSKNNYNKVKLNDIGNNVKIFLSNNGLYDIYGASNSEVDVYVLNFGNTDEFRVDNIINSDGDINVKDITFEIMAKYSGGRIYSRFKLKGLKIEIGEIESGSLNGSTNIKFNTDNCMFENINYQIEQ